MSIYIPAIHQTNHFLHSTIFGDPTIKVRPVYQLLPHNEQIHHCEHIFLSQFLCNHIKNKLLFQAYLFTKTHTLTVYSLQLLEHKMAEQYHQHVKIVELLNDLHLQTFLLLF